MPIPIVNQLETAFAYDPDVDTINTIPQINTNPLEPNNASFEKGFPSITMPVNPSSGLPPKGQDFNGILSDISKLSVWQCVGGGFPYNSTLYNNTNAYITGYPIGARVKRSDNEGYWISTVDNNQTDPDSLSSVGWQPDIQTDAGYIVFTANGQTTYTVSKIIASKNIFIIANDIGIIAAPVVEIILPKEFSKNYYFFNTTDSTLLIKTDDISSNTITMGKTPASTIIGVINSQFVSDLSNYFVTRPNFNSSLGLSNFYTYATTGPTIVTTTQSFIPLIYQEGSNWISGGVFQPDIPCNVAFTINYSLSSGFIVGWRLTATFCMDQLNNTIANQDTLDTISTGSAINFFGSMSGIYRFNGTTDFLQIQSVADAQTSTIDCNFKATVISN